MRDRRCLSFFALYIQWMSRLVYTFTPRIFAILHSTTKAKALVERVVQLRVPRKAVSHYCIPGNLEAQSRNRSVPKILSRNGISRMSWSKCVNRIREVIAFVGVSLLEMCLLLVMVLSKSALQYVKPRTVSAFALRTSTATCE